MRNRFEVTCDWIAYACNRYPMRFVEVCGALMLLAPGAFVINKRVQLAGLVKGPPYTSVYIFAGILTLTAIAHILGMFMPMIHRWFERRGTKAHWLIHPWFKELLWRRVCCGVAAFEMGIYAALISAIWPMSLLLAVPYIGIMNVALIRLGGHRDARHTTDDALVVDRPSGTPRRRRGDFAVPHLSAAPPDEGPAKQRRRPIHRAAETDRRKREPATGLPEPIG